MAAEDFQKKRATTSLSYSVYRCESGRIEVSLLVRTSTSVRYTAAGIACLGVGATAWITCSLLFGALGQERITQLGGRIEHRSIWRGNDAFGEAHLTNEVVVYVQATSNVDKLLSASGRYHAPSMGIVIDGVTVTNLRAVALCNIDNLSWVSADNCGATDREIALLGRIETITDLSLSGNPIRGCGFQKWRRPKSLRTLCLQGTQIDDAGALHLAAFESLEKVDLSGTSITDVSCVALSRLPRVSALSLAGTAVSDAGIQHFSNSRLLSELDLRGTKVTQSGIERLRSHRPRLIVVGPGVGPGAEVRKAAEVSDRVN